jgi:hypothetical protein
MGVVEYATLEHVSMQARPYPAHLLEGCDTGLCLFAAAFLGHNDAIHFAEAGIVGTCLDVDEARLQAMRAIYPREWSFHTADAWEWARGAREEAFVWDVVSADSFTGAMLRRSLDSLDLWCSLARELVTATIVAPREWPRPPDWLHIPEGWEWSMHPRSGTVYWLVLTR